MIVCLQLTKDAILPAATTTASATAAARPEISSASETSQTSPAAAEYPATGFTIPAEHLNC